MDNYACCRSMKEACITSGDCECTQGRQEQGGRLMLPVVKVKHPFSFTTGEGMLRFVYERRLYSSHTRYDDTSQWFSSFPLMACASGMLKVMVWLPGERSGNDTHSGVTSLPGHQLEREKSEEATGSSTSFSL